MSGGELAENIVALVLAVLLIGYLFYALVRPERY